MEKEREGERVMRVGVKENKRGRRERLERCEEYDRKRRKKSTA